MLFSGTRNKSFLYIKSKMLQFCRSPDTTTNTSTAPSSSSTSHSFKSLLRSSDNPASIAEIVSISSSKIRSICRSTAATGSLSNCFEISLNSNTLSNAAAITLLSIVFSCYSFSYYLKLYVVIHIKRLQPFKQQWVLLVRNLIAEFVLLFIFAF